MLLLDRSFNQSVIHLNARAEIHVKYMARRFWFAGVAQLVEQLTCNQQVAGSSPITSSTRSFERLYVGRITSEGCPSG